MQSELRKKLLNAFTNNEEEYLSGQAIADVLGCSRTAVWKHIESLRKEGFELEAVRRKGYRIIGTPDKVIADEISLGLKTEDFGRSIHYEEVVETTQKVAHRLANEGAKEGTIVVAEEQSNGRGRMDRKWVSPKYTGIWLSIILRPNLPPHKAPQLTLIAAVSVVQAIEEVTGLSPEIKWPNDVLLNGKKITGILTEMQADADRIASIIMGIGINVNQSKEDYPPELQDKATSLAIEKGQKISRAELIQALLLKLENLYKIYIEKGFHPIKLLWESYAVSIGKYITARTLTGAIAGKAIGITDEGVLLLEDGEGKTHHIYSADIEIG
ncbi:BirA family transcriptional regulator, biotin operon repressor / biotin---[acetyl-CoA-carboxylase] ligase [Cytobacillus horneckiae]|uniref:Bifunctional ligase/repressor BirA n=1 Tax=Cytobacillus horneckiae TaxID=549687 RepID=A0A2N0ZCS7_9BACI|nr:biotin--[acetyl-CoA-carboxylase] ligase [Cytobacillus horneckiae]NRG43194.1 biotin--[acetyl-CoA-carboxylase] ligase [Bacillus sp. CRN 9]MBN6888447.1 biotin--[acetyl-CoA-carboxylase] ligase [Cytobacillus horneckiae]MEC1156512.1 biotin--[acetyl-CoA-carboxylase] ligase [Cytobacillus horneckiae]MED2938963.1 biotin--[acetyl-CoA-carboxylase] ligase [Cytobacillus horneckiae]PKG27295.1 biotin--[acetyl-CoA-carboxylase] ligase [Cytobacillus horneckiae]